LKHITILIVTLGLSLACVKTMDAGHCESLRAAIKEDERLISEAEAHLAAIKPRTDGLSKRIDDLSIKEANDYLDRGVVNPDTERQLAQLRTEYDRLTSADRHTISFYKELNTEYQQKVQSAGCP
jgi:cell division septum initiation protein DivIVA